MNVFVTGATGFIGSAVVRELISAGHQVLGLTRSDTGAQALLAAGAKVHRGDLGDLESLRNGARQSDGVIHLGFIHDFSNFAANCETDKRAIEALGTALTGTDKPLLVSGGLFLPVLGRTATEEDALAPPSKSYPRASEATTLALASQGIRAAVVRLPQVHDTVKQGLITFLIKIAREKGVSAYIGEGCNRWAAAHVLDVARLYRLALENGSAGTKYHAVAEEGVALRDIAEVIGRGLKLPVVSKSPEEAAEHFGVLGHFVGGDGSASSALTQERLGWHPTGPGMIADLENMRYFPAEVQTAKR